MTDSFKASERHDFQRRPAVAERRNYNVAIERLAMPVRIQKLPIDARGYPVPRFVKWIDGVPDFRVVDPDFMARALRNRLCFVCGEKMGAYMALVTGPMCVCSGTVSEPGQHLACAQFVVRACPFITQPNRARNEHGLPEDKVEAGIMIKRNPGVTAIYVTKTITPFRPPIGGGILFRMGEPTSVEWYARGRRATREEVLESITTGLPLLEEAACAQGPDAVAALQVEIKRGMALVPA
jgi:hypothetical protein